MKKLHLVFVMTLLLVAASALAAEMGSSDGFDLDALWRQAQTTHDLSQTDAVVLLEQETVAYSADSDLATTIHRVVWIGSTVAVHQYADLRVPWNSANSTLDVAVLRTWRDGRWWPDPVKISKTAVVETLPYAVDHADDYTTMRETMLLHDGIELPCILETRYTITRHHAAAAEGVFVFAQRDPAVRAQLTVTTPADAPWHAETMNGAPTPLVTVAGNRRTVVWDMSPVSALGLPATTEPAAHEPTVIYSTWDSWAALGQAFGASFDKAAFIDGALADTLSARTEFVHDPLAMAQATLDLVQESTRRIHNDAAFWPAPRPAMRTWETGYGNDLDRLALAAGMLRSLAVVPTGAGVLAGPSLTAEPVFLGHGTVALAPDVPRLAEAGDLALDIALPGDLRLLWTPDGTLHGASFAFGRPVTMPSTKDQVFVAQPDADNLLAIDLTITPTLDEGWTWSGTVTAQGMFSFQGAVITGENLDKAAAAALDKMAPDLSVDSCNPREFTPLDVVAVCSGELAEPEENDTGDRVLTLGDPAGGVFHQLPHDIHLYQSKRTSAVLIPAMAQTINVQMPLNGFVVRRLPATVDLRNGAGHFIAHGAVKNGHLIYTRTLKLTGQGTWSELRALLIEANDDAHRDIVLDTGGEK